MEAVMDKIGIEKYPAYKDSGEQWFGEIPKHWEVSRLGKILTPTSLKNRPELPLLSITREKGVILRDMDNDEKNHNFIPDDLSNYKVVKQGEFGMNKMKAWQGSYGISSYTGIVSPAYYTFVLDSNIVPEFFHIAIRSRLYVSYFGSASDGVRVGQWDLSKERMKQIPFLIPSIEEQTAIANFLNCKSTQIDKAIAQKEKLIELLKERRQILIHKAVTRGLDPNVRMKYSGVEWIGEIPEHWDVMKITYALSLLVDGTHFSPKSYDEGEYKYITAKNIKEQGFDFSDISYVNQKDHVLIYKRCPVKKGDILYIKDGATAGIATINTLDEQFSLLSSVAVIRPKTNLLQAAFLKHYLNSELIRGFMNTQIVGGAMTRLTIELIKEYKVIVPPLEEQNRISRVIENTGDKIFSIIRIKEQEIEKLKEYKATLINAAVTGKIKVA